MKKRTLVLVLILVVVGLVYVGMLEWSRMADTPSSAVPKAHDPSVEAAQAYINEGDLVSAESTLLEGLGPDEYHEHKYYLLSFIYINSGDFKEAFKYAKPLAERSSDPKVLTDLGSLFAMAGYEQMGFACYSKALSENQGYIPAYIELGKLYGNQSKFIQAISVWQDGLRVDPENREIMDLIRQANALWQQQGQAQE